MKTKILTFLTALTLIFSSCSNNDDSGNNDGNNHKYYIKAKINDQLIEYKYDAATILPNNGNTISAYAKAVPNQPFPAFTFEITDPTGVKVQSYEEPNNNMIFKLAIEEMITYSSEYGDVEDFNIKITEITNNHIKGSFSGKVFLLQSTDGANFYLTEGKFFLERNLK